MRVGGTYRAGVDGLALAVVLICAVLSGVYLALVTAQDDQPVAWFAGGLIAAGALALYGAFRPRRGRVVALVLSGLVLSGLGLLALLSIGLPVLAAGVAAFVAAARSRAG